MDKLFTSFKQFRLGFLKILYLHWLIIFETIFIVNPNGKNDDGRIPGLFVEI